MNGIISNQNLFNDDKPSRFLAVSPVASPFFQQCDRQIDESSRMMGIAVDGKLIIDEEPSFQAAKIVSF